MAIFRGRMFFQAGPYGWTEDVFLERAAASDALAAIQRLANARSALLAKGMTVGHVSVSDTAVRGDSLVKAVPGQSKGTWTGEPFEGLWVRVEARNGEGASSAWTHRNYFLRGVAPGSGNFGSLQRYMDLVIAERCCLGAYDRSAEESKVLFVCDEIDDGVVSVFIDTPKTFPLADPMTGIAGTVAIRGVRWKGLGKRRNPTDGVRILAGSQPYLVSVYGSLPPDAEYLSGGTVQARTVSYARIRAWTPRMVGVRKTGKGASADVRFGGSLAEKIPESQPIPSGPVFGAKPSEEVPGLVPIVPSERPDKTLTNARDVFKEVSACYDNAPIGIAKVLNYKNTYLVVCSGTQLEWNSAVGIKAAVTSAFALSDRFQTGLFRAVSIDIPTHSTLIMAGHSQGGMQQQIAIAGLQKAGYTVHTLLTYGSPQVTFEAEGVNYRRFKTGGDFVPDLTPMGAGWALLGHPNQIHIDGKALPDIISQHRAYGTTPALTPFDCIGDDVQVGRVELQIRAVSYHHAEPPWF